MQDYTIQNNKLLLLGKLTASLLHEIRNPLSVIKLGIDHLNLIKEELPEEAFDTINSSAIALERIQLLVDNVLDFSRKSKNDNSLCSINQITEYSIKILDNLANKVRTRIKYELDNQIPLLLIDKNKILQVFVNLITNAIEACECNRCKTDKQILITTYIDDENNIVWQIKDEGIGINEEQKNRIFDDFYTSKTSGTGLGLSVCSNILHELESKLILESEEGKGATFSIIFNPSLVKECV